MGSRACIALRVLTREAALRPLPTLVLSLFFATPTVQAQLIITEVLVDPVGPNRGHQIVEISNPGPTAISPENEGLSLAVGLDQVPLPENTIPPGGVVRLHIGTFGPNSETDFYIRHIRYLEESDTLSILGPKILDNGEVMDFVSWGGGTARIQQALASFQWDSENSSVTLPAREGNTIARLGQGSGPAAWFQDTTPTIGRTNDAAGYGTIVRRGCQGSAGTASLEPAAALPWTGGAFTAAITNLPPILQICFTWY